MNILSLSAVYPTAAEPGLGIFVKKRLDRMTEFANVRVVAPAPRFDYAKARVATASAGTASVAATDAMDVSRPKWWYPPGGGVLNPPLLAMQTRGEIRRIRREFAFDVIDAHFAYPTGVAAAILAADLNCPFTITLRGDETMHAATSRWRAKSIDWALRRASAVFAVSGRLREWAISRGGVSPDRAFTIPNGIDNNVFRISGDEADREEIRRSVGASNPEDRLVLAVGYLIERKGHHHLIRAVHELKGRGEKVIVAIAGEPGREGSYAETLHELTASLGMESSVCFLGNQSQKDVARWMNAADLFVLASSREGWPNVVQEALACGCPVIASDIGGTPDMIPDSRYGYILEQTTPECLVGALREALTRAQSRDWDRKRIAEWGSRRSWTQVASEVVSCLERTVIRRDRQPGGRA